MPIGLIFAGLPRAVSDLLNEGAGQTLRTRLAALKERTESPARVSVTVRLREGRLDLARRILGTRIHEVSDPEKGWCTVVVRYPDVESVRQLLQFGDHIEVLTPETAR